MRTGTLKWINTISFAAMVIVNGLANLIPIGGKTTGQVSQAYPNMFTPAPLTFAIWGVIYLLLLLFVLYQWGIFDKGKYSDRIRDRIGILFAVSCALNITWIFLWHFEAMFASTICIAALLLSLILIGGRLKKTDGNFTTCLMVNTGFDLYFGWIIAATIANVCVFLTKIGWNGWGLPEQFWTAALLIIASVIGSATVLKEKKLFSVLGVIWAFIGIMIRHISAGGYGGANISVICAGIAGIVIMLCSIPIAFLGCYHCRRGEGK